MTKQCRSRVNIDLLRAPRLAYTRRSPNDKMSPHSLSAASVFVMRHLSLVLHSLIHHSSFLLLIFLPALQAADNISVLGSKPRWSVLEHYQETITRDDFARVIQSIYCTHGFRSEEHTSELQSLTNLVCRLLLEKKKKKI